MFEVCLITPGMIRAQCRWPSVARRAVEVLCEATLPSRAYCA